MFRMSSIVLPRRLTSSVSALKRARVDEAFPKRLVQDVTDERALPRARRARHRDELTQRKSDSQRFEVVLAGAAHDERLAGSLAALPWRRDRPRPRQILTRRRR